MNWTCDDPFEETAISAAWSRIEAWIRVNQPQLLDTLGAPATDDDFALLEAEIGRSLSEEFKSVYRLRNGQMRGDVGLLNACEWLSLDSIAHQYRIWKSLSEEGAFEGLRSEAPDGVREDWWSPGWIPITHNGGGDHQCLDLNPAPGGARGQIIDFFHDDPTRVILATGIEAWLAAYATALENGRVVYSDDYGGLVDRDNV